MNSRFSAIIFGVALVLSSCIRDGIHGIQTNYHVRYDIDYNVMYNVPSGVPEMLWLRFYDVTTGKRIYETWANPEGTDMTITPGQYHIVAYSYRNDATKYSYESDLKLLTVSTAATRATSGQKVINAPDHFFYGVLHDGEVPYVAVEDPAYEIVIPMSSPLDSWRVIVTGVKGLKNNRGIAFYITHQYEDILLSDMIREGDAILQFSGRVDSSLENIDTAFNTFGMVPGQTYTLQIQIKDAAGLTYIHSEDITGQVLDPDNKEHIITLHYDVSLLEMVQGGVEPSAEEWEESYEHHIFS